MTRQPLDGAAVLAAAVVELMQRAARETDPARLAQREAIIGEAAAYMLRSPEVRA